MSDKLDTGQSQPVPLSPEGKLASTENVRRLSHILHKIQRQLQWDLLVGYALRLGSVFLTVVLLASWLIWGGLSVRVCTSISILLLVLLGTLVTILAIIERYRTASSPVTVAKWMDRVTGHPQLIPLLDATELSHELGQAGSSDILRHAAISSALHHADNHQIPDIAAAESAKTVRRRGVVTLALLIATGATAVTSPSSVQSLLGSIFSAEGLQRALSQIPPEPQLGEMQITYRYPEYTRKLARRVTSLNGRIQGLPGTEVTIETQNRTPLKSGVAVLSYGKKTKSPLNETEEQRIQANVSGRSIRIQFVISRAGRYRLELIDKNNVKLTERYGHDIFLETDESPKVELLSPAESPLEVNHRDKLKLSFRAEDDFLLGKARIAWRVLGTAREGKQILQADTQDRNYFAGSTRLNLATLKLKPGDHVAYSVEVLDNDVINGPKFGASETKELRIYSEKSHHEKVMKLEMEALDAAIHLLGDNLETPFGPFKHSSPLENRLKTLSSMEANSKEVIKKLKIAAVEIRRDPLGRPNVGDAFDAAAREIQRRIGSVRRARQRLIMTTRRAKQKILVQVVQTAQNDLVDTLERHTVYLSDLIDDQRMMDAESLAKDLRAQQEALRKALEEYKAAPSEEMRQRIAQAIKDIQKRIQEIMSELAQLRNEIPQDFVNTDSLTEQAPDMRALQQQIEEGNLDEALQSLDQMLNQTERMLSQLQEGRDELQTREYSEITQRAEQLWRELEEVKSRQHDLAERTDKIAQALKERSEDRLGDVDKFIESNTEKLNKASEILKEIKPERHLPNSELFELAERRVSDGRDALQGQDFSSAQNVLEQALRQMKSLHRSAKRRAEQAERFGGVFGMSEQANATDNALSEANPLVDEVIKALRELAPNPSELLEDNERQQLNQFEREQGALSEKAEGIQSGLEELGEQLPIVGPEVRAAIDEAKAAMGQSGQQLKEGNAPGALSQERRAVEALDRLAQQLEEMGSQSDGGQGSSGVPLPFGQPQGNDRDNERGGQGRLNRDRVEIPKPDQYQAPSEFREDLLEAAKQGTVKSYRDAVRRYYEELVK